MTWRFLSHRDVVRRVQRVWARARIARGDAAFVGGDAPSLASAVEILAFNADGHTQVLVGSPGNELEEIAMLHPQKIVASADVVRRLLESTSTTEMRPRTWLARAASMAMRLGRDRDRDAMPVSLGRTRWLSTGPSLEFATRARMRKFVTLEIDESLV
jgi:hypothetical protein